MPQPLQIDEAVQRVEALLAEFAEEGDPRAAARAEELVRVLMEVYGAGLRRIVEMARDAGDGLPERMARDRLVASLFVIHDLHPVPPEARIREALSRVERRLDGRRLSAEVQDGIATVHIEPGGAPEALAAGIEQAVMEAAPELERVEIEGIASALVHIAPAREA